MQRVACVVCVPVAAFIAVGCASEKKKDGDGRASSLVYSPAARLPAEGGSGSAAGDAASSSSLQQDDVRPPAGRRVRIHLRRDAMGVAGQAPYPITGNNLAADRAQVTGTLERVGREWLVVRGDRSTYWLPRDVVLAIEFAD